MSKKAFITGVSGQDGAWLAKLLIDKGYEVYGGVRRTSRKNFSTLEFVGVLDKIKLVEFELTEYSNMFETIRDIQPDEFYNLAAQSFVGTSFAQPISTSLVDGLAVAQILDILKQVSPKTKFYQASTSEMYGKVQAIPQTETTPFYPRSPYGVAKLYAHWMVVNYRESYDMFTTSGILFNHESELRGPEFVTRKITIHAATWVNGNKGKILELGNLDASRDWGYAKEYVEGMYLMIQAKEPDTFVLATNQTTKIRDFVNYAFTVIDREVVWEGSGVNEVGKDKKTGETLVKVNPDFFRPAEVDLLIGDPKKAKEKLNWEPKVGPKELAEIMMKHDISLLKI